MDNNRKVFTFFGADSKVGVTMIAQSVAEKISGNGQKVLMICCDGKEGNEYTKQDNLIDKGIDAIYTELESDVLTINQFLDACIVKNKLYILSGTVSLVFRNRYTPNFVKKLVDIAVQYFDFVILDAGSSTDMGLSMGALEHSDLNILITTQQKSAENAYFKKQTQIFLKVDLKFDYNVVNKYEVLPFFPDAIDIKNRYKIEKTTEVPLVENFGWKAEKDKNTLLSYNLKKYNMAITAFVRILIGEDATNLEQRYNGSIFRRKKNEQCGL